MTVLKRWEENGHFFLIQKCRWCDKFVKRRVSLGDSQMIAKPEMITLLVEEAPGSHKVQESRPYNVDQTAE